MQENSEKLKQIRLKSGKSQAEFAKEIGVSQRTWSAYESGETRPKMAILLALENLGYDISGVEAGSAPRGIKSAGAEADALGQNHFESKVESGDFVIPILEQSLSAGHGKELPEKDSPTGYIAVPKELKRYGNNLAALYVSGDSMEPTLHRGDLIVCDSCGWDGEGIYALRMNGEGFVKRLSQKPGKLVVISDNPKYAPWEENAENTSLEIIGRVHYALKKAE
uniref:HTH cro/C1-type domain-containing protein n=1 Tax=uncultured Spirochaetaceae bacterium TaxID=201186 RepID=A0A650ENA6_9SPIO|nr:hypothetical protein Unknown280_0290 [uncultured Spirochaetaceae bacterium]